MSTQVVPGTLVTAANSAEVAHLAAARMAEIIRGAQKARGAAYIALSGGNTPRDAYRELAQAEDIDWNAVEVFWVDERSVAPTDERSNFHWAKVTLLDGAKIPEARVHRMKSEQKDLDEAARSYAEELKIVPKEADLPVFDFLVMGVGDDGHTASLFPGSPMVDIRDRWVTSVPQTGKYEPRISLTAPVIEAGRNVLVLAAGAAKQEPLTKVWAVAGSTTETPARILRHTKHALVWIIDRAAGGL